MDENDISALRKFMAPEVVFGVGARFMAERYVKNLGGRNILLVTDAGVIKAGWANQIISSLKKSNVPTVIYQDITPNPKADEVMAGAEVFRKENCNMIIAVGGGSPMDCAKGIGIVISNDRHILDFEGVDMVAEPMPPLICIPTTGGTSADVSQFAIINHSQEKRKIAIISKAVVPDVALIDPATLTTMDAHLTACTGVDALVHAIEACVSNASSPLTDLHALEAIRQISTYLLPSIKEPSNLEFREKVMLGSLEAGFAFSNASLGAVHAMAHSLGGLLDLPHGECNALLLRNIIEFNFDSAFEKYLKIGRSMGVGYRKTGKSGKKKALLDAIGIFITSAGINESLSLIGVKKNDIPELARKAILDPCMATNPRRPTVGDIEDLYEKSL